MKRMLRLPLIALLACANVARGVPPETAPPMVAASSPEPTVRTDGDELHYTGLLNKAGLQRLRDALERQPALRVLRIDSSGGEAYPAIDIATLVRARRMDVIVDGRCNSACANFLFVPAPHKTILLGSIVFWHNACPQNVPRDIKFDEVLNGGFDNISGNISLHGRQLEGEEKARFVAGKKKQIRRQMRGYFAEYGKRQQAFFADAPYDSRIVCLSDYLSLPDGSGQGYTLSVADMARFGVCNVYASSDYPASAVATLLASSHVQHARVLRLDDYPDFKPAHAGPACMNPASDAQVDPDPAPAHGGEG